MGLDLKKLEYASFETKSTLDIPEGAEITNKKYTLIVKEIMNGFIVRKCWDIKYDVDGDERCSYYTEEYYTKTNPMTIDFKEKSLADKLGG